MRMTLSAFALLVLVAGCGGGVSEEQQQAVDKASSACNGLLANEPKGTRSIQGQAQAGANAATRAARLDEEWKPLADLATDYLTLMEELFAATDITDLPSDFPEQVGDTRNAIVDECERVEQAGGEVTADLTKT